MRYLVVLAACLQSCASYHPRANACLSEQHPVGSRVKMDGKRYAEVIEVYGPSSRGTKPELPLEGRVRYEQ